MKEAAGGEEDRKGDGEIAEAEGDKGGGGGGGGEGSGGESKTEMDLPAQRLCTFLDLLNDVFWRLFVRRPSSAAVAPVVNPGGYF